MKACCQITCWTVSERCWTGEKNRRTEASLRTGWKRGKNYAILSQNTPKVLIDMDKSTHFDVSHYSVSIFRVKFLCSLIGLLRLLRLRLQQFLYK